MVRSHRSVAAGLVVIAALSAPALLAAPASAQPTPGMPAGVSGQPAPPPGAIAWAIARNQLTYCSLICPHIVDGLVEVPVALVRAPGVYAQARALTGSADRALGIASASVTAPARSAMTGIIDNDLQIVLPRAQNALEVAVVEVLTVNDTLQAGAPPSVVRRAVDDGRIAILDALNAPVVADPPQIARPSTPAQIAAVDAIEVGSAVLFQAPEIVMAGATESADIAAGHLAVHGDPLAARRAGTRPSRPHDRAGRPGDRRCVAQPARASLTSSAGEPGGQTVASICVTFRR